jgi:hypothetical protein
VIWHEQVERATEELARRTSRRSFLGIVGRGAVALAGGSFVAAALDPQRAEARYYTFCGHTYTTGSCPHPFAPYSRIDRFGYPLHPKFGYPVDDQGAPYTSKTQTRSQTCSQMTREKYPYTGHPELQGTWSRCCGGRVRRLWDCCSFSRKRINGDASLVGYCYHGRRVFCVTYRDTDIKC